MSEHKPILSTTGRGFLTARAQLEILRRVHYLNTVEGIRPTLYTCIAPSRNAYKYEAAKTLIRLGLVYDFGTTVYNLQISAVGLREIAYWAAHPELCPTNLRF